MEGRYLRTPEQVFRDFKGRRSGILKALIEDREKFSELCDPEKENLCLFAFPNGTWKVNLPAHKLPAELPEPSVGINFARVGMKLEDWLAEVASLSDVWLLSLAFYFGARFGFDKDARKRLFFLINSLPTLRDIITGKSKRPYRVKTAGRSYKRKLKSKPSNMQTQAKALKRARLEENKEVKGREEEGYEQRANLSGKVTQGKEGVGYEQNRCDKGIEGREEVEYEQNGDYLCGEEIEGMEQEGTEQNRDNLCAACGETYANDQFWICCDTCNRWFHGRCVKMTPAKAKHIEHYDCPICTNKRAGVESMDLDISMQLG